MNAESAHVLVRGRRVRCREIGGPWEGVLFAHCLIIAGDFWEEAGTASDAHVRLVDLLTINLERI